jgi:hypothetical protein
MWFINFPLIFGEKFVLSTDDTGEKHDIAQYYPWKVFLFSQNIFAVSKEN